MKKLLLITLILTGCQPYTKEQADDSCLKLMYVTQGNYDCRRIYDGAKEGE